MQLLQLLEFCVSWLVGVTGWTPQYGPWLYTLLVRLEKPLTPDTARCCGTSPPPGRGRGEPPASGPSQISGYMKCCDLRILCGVSRCGSGAAEAGQVSW